jgi:hypothetical protein
MKKFYKNTFKTLFFAFLFAINYFNLNAMDIISAPTGLDKGLY